ncbi:UDP-N-acetyl-D-mannosamine dehydrogenase [Caldalkalibacillus thermarum]|uniref:nucleotide sugar dehydrogenase n=1 Tax=Caldalkalibacillus thermarum TaxID=296745 RepID=UPI00166B226F|nr:nucleotide sugar dehydrogenase [Caldalkalibacillus thermarum]GGK29025.1 UDP-N-acetyl-D-mannosamine dehydrogenase [Caldalkalibacillus thermarum]
MMKKLCVMGLGYIGLPTAVMFAKHGLKVHGVDVNPVVVETLQKKQLHIEEPGLKEMMTEVMDNGRLEVSTAPAKADAFIIAVPTPIKADKTANLDYVKSATEMIVPYLEKGNLVILESTVPPRTVEDVMVPILQRSGLNIGEDLYVSHSPERVLPGQLFKELVDNDRIVGGINEKSAQLTVELYKTFVKGKIHVTDATTAEMVKLMENTYRDVNIALANEFARIAEKVGFNVWEAIELANCHPRVNIHRPGPGVGGHCIAVDPWFIIEQAPEEAKLITTARNINDSMPYHVVHTIEELVKTIDNPVISLFGLAFKGNIDDMRESPSLVVLEELRNKGYELKIYDPYVKAEIPGKVDGVEEALSGSDLLVILTDHKVFAELDFASLKGFMRNHNVLDTRHICSQEAVQNAGFKYFEIGSKLPLEVHV